MSAVTETETRQRIVVATVELHQTLGPAKQPSRPWPSTTRVQRRAAVYNRFPDLQVLFAACNACFFERHPMPNPTSWVGIASPNERFHVAVRELYRWYQETETMLSVGIRGIDLCPPSSPRGVPRILPPRRLVHRWGDAASEVVSACARRQPSATRSRS